MHAARAQQPAMPVIGCLPSSAQVAQDSFADGRCDRLSVDLYQCAHKGLRQYETSNASKIE
jgi:hypothetical protein